MNAINIENSRLEAYNIKKELLAILTDKANNRAYNISLTKNVNDADKLSFSIPADNEKIKYLINENFVKFEGEFYVIKNITLEDEMKCIYNISCEHEVSALKDKLNGKFDIIADTPQGLINAVLNGTGWVYGGTDIPADKKRHLISENDTVFGNLISIATVFNARLEFSSNSSNKSVFLRVGDINRNRYIRKRRDLKAVSLQYDTTEMVTKLEVFGKVKEGTKTPVTMMEVNPTKKSYIENYEYYIKQGFTVEEIKNNPNCIKELTINNTDLSTPQMVYDFAVEELKKLSVPKVEASISAIDISLIPDYFINPLVVGEKIYIYDEDINLELEAMVTSTTKNYDNPFNLSINISNVIDNNSALKQLIQSQQTIDRITNGGDGINGGYIDGNSINADSIVAKSITADQIATGAIVAGSGVIAEGAIGNLEVSKLSADKLSAGTIDTSLVRVASNDSAIEITGKQIMVNDTTDLLKPYNRVILGKYMKPTDNGTEEEYGLLIRSKDGRTVMLDGDGIHNAGITDGAVNNNKISDDANIDGGKLNIQSVIRTINEDTGVEKIAGTQVSLDNKGLDIVVSEINQKQDDNSEQIESVKSEMSVHADQIKLRVTKQEYDSYNSQLNDSLTHSFNQQGSILDKHTSQIEILEDKIELKVTKDEVKSLVDSIEVGSDNYLVNTDFRKGILNWGQLIDTGATVNFGVPTTENGISINIIKHAGWGFRFYQYVKKGMDFFNTSSDYNISFDYKSNKDCTLTVNISDDAGVNSNLIDIPVKATTTFKRVNATVNIKNALTSKNNRVAIYSSAVDTLNLVFHKFMLVKGNKTTDYKPSRDEQIEDGIIKNQEILDMKNSIKNVNDLATEAKNDAKKSLDDISDIISDSKLTPNEKFTANKEFQNIITEKAHYDSLADEYGVVSEKQLYNTRYNELSDYITPLISNMTITSTIVSATYLSKFNNYYEARQKLINKVNLKAKELEKKLNDMKIGGVNMSLNSAFFYDVENWNIDKTVGNIAEVKEEFRFKKYLRTDSTRIVNKLSNEIGKLKINDEISLSFWAKGDINDIKLSYCVTDELEKNPLFPKTQISLTNDWKFYEVTFKSLKGYLSDYIPKIVFNNDTTTSVVKGKCFCLTQVQLEFSSKVTAWKPAREDLDSEIALSEKRTQEVITRVESSIRTDLTGIDLKYDGLKKTTDEIEREFGDWSEYESVKTVTEFLRQIKIDTDGISQRVENTEAMSNENKKELTTLYLDNKVTPYEKKQLKEKIDNYNTERIELSKQAYLFGIEIEMADYANAFGSFYGYLFTDPNILGNMNVSSDIVREHLTTKDINYISKRQILVNKLATVAKNAGDFAQQTANEAKATIGNMANDNVVTPAEKSKLKQEYTNILNERTTYVEACSRYGLEEERTIYIEAYNALRFVMEGILKDLLVDSLIDGQFFIQCSTNYYNSRLDISNKIVAKAKEQAIEYSKNAINDLTVGGVNLIDGTEFKNTNGYKAFNSVITTNTPKLIITKANGITDSMGCGVETTMFDLKAGKKYIVSFKTGSTLPWDYIYIRTSQNSSIKKIGTSHSPVNGKVSIIFDNEADVQNCNLLIGWRANENSRNLYELKVEEGDKATGWSPSNKDVSNNINEVKLAVDSLKDLTNEAFKDGVISIAEAKSIKAQLKVLDTEKRDIDSEYTVIYSNSLLPVANASSLATKKNDYDAKHASLKQTINTAIADGKTTNQELDSVNTAYDAYGVSLGVLKTSMSESLALINEKMAENKVNTMVIGGANLFKGTGYFDSSYWYSKFSLEPFEINPRYKMATTDGSEDGINTLMVKQGVDFSDKNKTWTISAMFKGSVSGQKIGVTLDIDRLDYQLQDVPAGVWTKLKWTFNGSKTLMKFRFSNANLNGTIKVASVMLEEGTKSNPWKPASEDFDASIAEINKELNDANMLENFLVIDNATDKYFPFDGDLLSSDGNNPTADEVGLKHFEGVFGACTEIQNRTDNVLGTGTAVDYSTRWDKWTHFLATNYWSNPQTYYDNKAGYVFKARVANAIPFIYIYTPFTFYPKQYYSFSILVRATEKDLNARSFTFYLVRENNGTRERIGSDLNKVVDLKYNKWVRLDFNGYLTHLISEETNRGGVVFRLNGVEIGDELEFANPMLTKTCMAMGYTEKTSKDGALEYTVGLDPVMNQTIMSYKKNIFDDTFSQHTLVKNMEDFKYYINGDLKDFYKDQWRLQKVLGVNNQYKKVYGDNPLINKVGTWVNADGVISSNVTGSYIEVVFVGTSIKLLANTNNLSGIAKVTLDGVSTNVDLFSRIDILGRTVYEKRLLSNGIHNLKIECVANKNDEAQDNKIIFNSLEIENGDIIKTGMGSTRRIEETDTLIRKVGTWTVWNNTSVSGGAEVYSSTAGSFVEFTFSGTGIKYITDVCNSNGIARVTIDGISSNVDLYSATTIYQKVVLDKTLEAGVHTIKIEYTGTKNSASSSDKVTIDAFEIKDGDMVSNGVSSSRVIEETDTNIVYNGTWLNDLADNYHNKYGKYTSVVGSSMTMNFVGTGIDIISIPYNNRGIMKVILDGVETMVDLYNPAYQFYKTVYSVTNLSQGIHTLQIVFTNQKNPSSTGTVILFDYFRIYNGDSVGNSLVEVTSKDDKMYINPMERALVADPPAHNYSYKDNKYGVLLRTFVFAKANTVIWHRYGYNDFGWCSVNNKVIHIGSKNWKVQKDVKIELVKGWNIIEIGYTDSGDGGGFEFGTHHSAGNNLAYDVGVAGFTPTYKLSDKDNNPSILYMSAELPIEFSLNKINFNSRANCKIDEMLLLKKASTEEEIKLYYTSGKRITDPARYKRIARPYNISCTLK